VAKIYSTLHILFVVYKLLLDTESPEYEVRTYETIDGKVPFNEWLKSFRDRKGRSVIRTRISRLQLGLFGDAKSVGEGVNELRLSFDPGYRIYYALEGKSVILLLCGGDIKYAG
jgi:putative addiction module killer protein